MKNLKLYLFLTILVFAYSKSVLGQSNNDIPNIEYEEKKTYKLPFEYINNFIVVKAYINDKFPLHFIFDTGAENTIFIEPSFVNILELRLFKEYKIMGADFQRILIAYLTKNIKFSFNEFNVENLDALVFKENYLNLDPYIGKQIAGIIGANFFKGKVLKINYIKKVIEIIPFDEFDPHFYKNYSKIPMNVKNSRGFVNVTSQISKDTFPLTLMIDTGAGISTLLYTKNEIITIPEKSIPSNIANGLGGEIEGYVARIKQLELGDLTKKDLIIHFQKLPKGAHPRSHNDRDGLIGNALLDNFTVIYDNIGGNLYLKPSNRFYKKDKYDRSGLSLLSSGTFLNKVEIHNILQDSPAERAGLMIGDEIIKMNGIGRGFISINYATKCLKKKVGKKIKLKIRRNGEIMKKTFRLEDIL